MSRTQVYVENVTKIFGDIKAVDTLSLRVERGEFLTLLGPSGCGKTTLLRIIAGFEEPTSGNVYIWDQDVTYVPPHKRPANMVFQRYALFPHLSVFENVAFGLRVKKLSDDEINMRVERMLALVQLEGFGKRKVNQLSGGQAQRVALARALINEPEVLLLDEPLGALDLKIRQQMEMELKLLHAQLGTTFIYVTHDQEEAMTIADRIVVMSQGRIIQDASPEQIYANPVNSFVADFIGHSNLIPAKVIQPEPTKLEFLGNSFYTQNYAGLEAGQEVKVLLRPEAFKVFAHLPKDLENVIYGQVIDATFKGPYVDYLVDTGGLRLKVHHSLHEGDQTFSRGDTIFLTWAKDDSLVLPL